MVVASASWESGFLNFLWKFPPPVLDRKSLTVSRKWKRYLVSSITLMPPSSKIVNYDNWEFPWKTIDRICLWRLVNEGTQTFSRNEELMNDRGRFITSARQLEVILPKVEVHQNKMHDFSSYQSGKSFRCDQWDSNPFAIMLPLV
jgi:hypothetical protein